MLSKYLLRSRIERVILKNKDKLSPFVVYNVLRSFSKMRDGKLAGSDKLYDELEPYVIKYLNSNEFSVEEGSHVIYSYSVRGSGSKELNALFMTYIKKNLSKVPNYSVLSNFCYYLLFNEVQELPIWKSLLDRFNEIEGKLQLIYYRPFKIAHYYLKHKYADKLSQELFDFADKFFDPEQIYNYVKNEKNYENDERNYHFNNILKDRLLMFPLTYAVYHNMFIVHFSFEHRKIGVNLFFEDDYVPKAKEHRLNSHALLHSNMMKLEGWKIINLSWEQWSKLGEQTKRDQYIHEWYQKTSIEQENANLTIIKPKFV